MVKSQFWQLIHQLAAGGTTIVVTTHYMDEAERCERVAMLWRGRLVALGAPREITAQFGTATLEDAFIALQERDEVATA